MGTTIFGGNFCTTAGGLINTAGGGVSTHDTTVTIQYAINGKAYTKTAISGGTTPTTDYNTGLAFPTMGASSGSAVVWALDSAGTVVCMMGPVQSLDVASGFIKDPEFPAVPNNVTPFAYQILKVASTGSGIVFGTSNWDATGFTNAIVDVLCLPSRPQVS